MSAESLRIEEVTDPQLIPELAQLSDITLEADSFHAFIDKYHPQSAHEETLEKMTAAMHDPDSHVFRAVLTSFDNDGVPTEQVVGCTHWFVGHLQIPKTDPFAPRPPTQKLEVSDVTVSAMAESNGQAQTIETAGQIEFGAVPNPTEAVDRAVGNALIKAIRGKRYIHLRRMIVHPDHQRKGIGQSLVQWGCDLADREKIVGWLFARPAGSRLYEKNGWKAAEAIEIDAPGMTVAPIVPMLRQPQSRDPRLT